MGGAFYSFSWPVVLGGHQMGIYMTVVTALESGFFSFNKLYFLEQF